MRTIIEILEELRQHPDHLMTTTFTKSEIWEELQEWLVDNQDDYDFDEKVIEGWFYEVGYKLVPDWISDKDFYGWEYSETFDSQLVEVLMKDGLITEKGQ